MPSSTIGSPVDDHAPTNTTSIYTAAEIFPMLPEVLSTDRTSLAASQERLAMVTEMIVAADGTIGRSAIYRAVVVNRAKLAYNSVAAWLDGDGRSAGALAAVPGMDEQLRLQDRVAQALRTVRRQHGAPQPRHGSGAAGLRRRGARRPRRPRRGTAPSSSSKT